MTAIVPSQPVAIGRTGIVSGAAVNPGDWDAITNSYNFLVGMGAALIPMCSMSMPLAAATPQTVNLRVWPRYATTHRLWVLSIDTSKTPTPWTFQDPSGGVRTFAASAVYGRQITHVETITSRTGLETTLSPIFTATLGGTLTGLGCYGIPRGVLAVGGALPAADAGEEGAFVRTGLPITDDPAGAGIGFIARELDLLRDTARRPGCFAWFSGGSTPYTVSSGTFVTILKGQPIALGRLKHNGDTTALLQLAAYMRSTTGGEIRWTMSSGAVVTVAIPVASTSTLLRSQIFTDCDDLGKVDGRRSNADDTCTIEVRAVGGGTVTVDSLTAGEGDSAAAAIVSPASRIGAPGRVQGLNRLPPRWMFPTRKRTG